MDVPEKTVFVGSFFELTSSGVISPIPSVVELLINVLIAREDHFEVPV